MAGPEEGGMDFHGPLAGRHQQRNCSLHQKCGWLFAEALLKILEIANRIFDKTLAREH